MKKLLKVVSAALIAAFILLLAITLIQRLSGKNPTLFGYQINYIKSPSMEPIIMTGDVILCKKTDASLLVSGDIVTYTNDGRVYGLQKGETVCHEVVEDAYIDSDGVWRVTTKGIANKVNDPLLTGEQIIGRYVKKLPLMTLFYRLLLSKWGFVVIAAPLFALLVLELIRMIVRERKRDSHIND